MATIELDDNIREIVRIETEFDQQLQIEMLRQRVRRDAKRMLEEEERAGAAVMAIDDTPIMAYDPLPRAIPELIPGLLPESGLAGIIGETECGKTGVSLELASCLLTGEPLWGQIIPTRTLEKVVYILGEHTVATLQGLYHRLQLPHSGLLQVVGPEHLHPYKALVSAGIAQHVAIDRMLKWTEGANLIIFDPLAGFAQGEKIENDNSAMRTLMDTLSLVAQKQNAACLVLHHMGKSLQDPHTGREIRRETYAARGATAIEDALTHCYYLRKKTLTSGKDGIEKLELEIRKFKGIPTHDSFQLERNGDTKRNTLVNPTSKAGKDTVSREERAKFYQLVQNLREANPKFSHDTCVDLIAAAHNIAKSTVRRWEGGSD